MWGQDLVAETKVGVGVATGDLREHCCYWCYCWEVVAVADRLPQEGVKSCLASGIAVGFDSKFGRLSVCWTFHETSTTEVVMVVSCVLKSGNDRFIST